MRKAGFGTASSKALDINIKRNLFWVSLKEEIKEIKIAILRK